MKFLVNDILEVEVRMPPLAQEFFLPYQWTNQPNENI
jgi:hypothetical protein